MGDIHKKKKQVVENDNNRLSKMTTTRDNVNERATAMMHVGALVSNGYCKSTECNKRAVSSAHLAYAVAIAALLSKQNPVLKQPAVHPKRPAWCPGGLKGKTHCQSTIHSIIHPIKETYLVHTNTFVFSLLITISTALSAAQM